VTIGQLLDRLTKLIELYGKDLEVDILTETDKAQVEQRLGDVAVPISSDKSKSPTRVKLLPEGF